MEIWYFFVFVTSFTHRLGAKTHNPPQLFTPPIQPDSISNQCLLGNPFFDILEDLSEFLTEKQARKNGLIEQGH